MTDKKLITIALQLVCDHYEKDDAKFDESCAELEQWCYDNDKADLAEYAMAYRCPDTAFFAMDGDADTCCEVGTYRCQKPAFSYPCGHEVFVDKCLSSEIAHLRSSGVTTIGCCCGHGSRSGYIQVAPGHEKKMLDLGYEHQEPHDGVGCGCFYPKSQCPPRPLDGKVER
ncbi:MAG: hypothetical protein IJ087_01450 [Eggerthellaceae bacterium]|nr:hypothetical protein [Eggerthellaceae bacterium]